jgi:hypothetical protein
VLISSNDRKQHSVGFYEGGASKPQAYSCEDDDVIPIPPPLGNTNLMEKAVFLFTLFSLCCIS